MKQLNFSTKSWHSILWKSTWGMYLPGNICNYFWSLLAAIILAPLAIIGHIFNFCVRSFNVVSAWWAIYFPACFLFGSMKLVDDKGGFNHAHHWEWYKILTWGMLVSIIAAIILAAIITSVLGIQYLVEKMNEKNAQIKKPIKRQKPNPIIEGIKAIKGRYCSKINWE